MDLKTFVAESIEQVIDGVVVAQEHARQHGAVVNPAKRQMSLSTRQTCQFDEPQLSQSIEFDVAVTVEEGSSKKAGARIFVAPLGLGGQRESATTAQTLSRVRFSVPVSLPAQKRA